MKKVSLFIAMSLDGYIADSKGSVEWLTGQGNDEDNIDSYSEFVKDIDTVVMGWNTYHQIVTELSPEDWVYDDFTTYVVTHKQKKSSDKIHFVNKNPVELIKELRKEKRLTQEQLAEKLNVSGRTVSRWETGTNMPDISLLTELAEFFDVSIPEIIDGERKSENMNQEVRETANKMADYASAEKENIIKNVRNQSLLGVCALVIIAILELAMPTGRSLIADTIHLYCETLVYVSVVMICFVSTGLLFKLKKGKKELNLPKPLLWIIAAVIAFVTAAVLKYLANLIL